MERSSAIVRGAGNAPARNNSARSLASCTLNPPLICPCPPHMASRKVGAEMISSSSTIANGFPTLSRDTRQKRSAPRASRRKLTTGFPYWSKLAEAFVSISPVIMARRFTPSSCPGLSNIGYTIADAPPRPVRVARSSTRWKPSFAVLPSKSLIRAGSLTPGSCTSTRESP